MILKKFIDYLSGNGMGDALTKREIRTQLRQLLLDKPMMDNNFALACSMLAGRGSVCKTLPASGNGLLSQPHYKV